MVLAEASGYVGTCGMGQGHHSDRLGRMVGLGDGGTGTQVMW